MALSGGDADASLAERWVTEFRNGALQTFSTAVQDTGTLSATKSAPGQMPEGVAFMKVEREARDTLAQVMSKMLQGLKGYDQAVEAVFANYGNLHELTLQRARALLKPTDAPAEVNSAFDPQWVLAHQAAHPELFPPRPPMEGS
ncbi:hypothetical protein HPO96_22750 [Kribbella sandramycini]|uniref:Uncharacterized protein n=1 Tax=Kribbella sandramycini TaxID=60450 RepID=A0A7Y4P0W1_9ACTN|nr:hypothetical protein [Kribbella sandramycini]MBB6566266.1 hypothetical protein [Kribbella sandramycini]NOL43071.1 hypothetical protein [Kribbella sandramycini]